MRLYGEPRNDEPRIAVVVVRQPGDPRQLLGDGFSVVPDPLAIYSANAPTRTRCRTRRPYEHLATHALPPPCVLPPTYAEEVPPGPHPVGTTEVER